MTALDDLLLKKYNETVRSSADAGDAANDTSADAIPVNENPVIETDDKNVAADGREADGVAADGDVPQPDTAEQGLSASPAEPSPIDSTMVADEIVTDEVVVDEVVVDEIVTVEEESTDTTPEEAPIAAIAPPIQFKPDWEIDRFPWPAICGEIEDRVESQLEEAVERISGACLQRECNTVVLTSAHSSSGRTTMTLCLAREAARQGIRVAIVDLDHAEPNMLECMGIDFEQGIESLHEAGVSAESICVTAIEDGVSLLPTVSPFAPDYAIGEATRQMLCTVAEHHELVLIDASREVADLIAGTPNFPAQGIIMINEPGASEATQAFIEWIKEKNAWTLGVIENFAA